MVGLVLLGVLVAVVAVNLALAALELPVKVLLGAVGQVAVVKTDRVLVLGAAVLGQ
jgi:hypothetical protein